MNTLTLLTVSVCATGLLIMTSCRSTQGNSSSMVGAGWPEEGNILPQAIAPKVFPRIPDANPEAAEVPPGYHVEVVVRDLDYPTSLTFDDAGNMYVAESGYSYGDPVAPARVLRIAKDGSMRYIADQFVGPITGLTWHQGRLYVSHFGKISIVQDNGTYRDVVTGLPLSPAHPNSEVTVGPDGKLYFGVGSFSNSGIVGLDEVSPFLGLLFWPDLHDVPPVDLKLTRESFVTPEPMNVLAKQGKLIGNIPIFTDFVSSLFHKSKHRSLIVRTGALQPFGQHAKEVHGELKGSTTILRMNPDGSRLELFAWGVRSPFGLRWGPDGKLYCSDNAYDERGSRPIANAKDNLWIVRQGGWYGFPDYSSGIPVTDPQFRSSRGAKPKPLLREHPPVEQPLFTRPAHSAVTKFDFSRSSIFGSPGEMFLAEFGSGTPVNAPGVVPAGYEVVRINMATRNVAPFFKLKQSAFGPKGYEHAATAGPRRPIDVRFSADGNTMYVVDFGAMAAFPAAVGPLVHPFPASGVIWRITKEGAQAGDIPANLSPLPGKSHQSQQRVSAH